MIGSTRESFRDLIQRISGVLTQWASEAVPFTPPTAQVPTGVVFRPTITTNTQSGLTGKAMLSIRVLSGLELGYDETRREFDSGSDKLVATQSGVRTYMVSMAARSFGDGPVPTDILELLRTRLMRKSVLAQLRALNLSLVHCHPVIELLEPNTQIAGRPIAGVVAVMDVKFGYAINDVDTLDPGDYINTVDTTGQISGTSGPGGVVTVTTHS